MRVRLRPTNRFKDKETRDFAFIILANSLIYLATHRMQICAISSTCVRARARAQVISLKYLFSSLGIQLVGICDRKKGNRYLLDGVFR